MIIQFVKIIINLNISPVIGFKAYLVELIRWLFGFGILFQCQFIHRTCKIRLIDTIIEHYRKYLFRFALCWRVSLHHQT